MSSVGPAPVPQERSVAHRASGGQGFAGLVRLIPAAAGYVAGGALLIVALTITLDVTLRWLVSRPITGLFELSELAFAAIMALSFAYATDRRAHVALELGGSLLGRPVGLRALASLLTAAVFAGFVWLTWSYASAKLAYGETTLVLGLPIGPFWYAIAALMAVSFVAAARVAVIDAAAFVRAPASARVSDMLAPALLVAACAGLGAFLITLHGELGPLQKLGLGFAMLYLMALAKVPLGIALTTVGFVGSYALLGVNSASLIVTNSLTSSLANADLAALPLFLLMGNLAISAGFADDIFEAASSLFGRLRGGHAVAAVIGCAGFGAISGSSLATTATIGRAAYGEMRARGYAMGLSTGSIAAGGTLGALVPPSVVLIIYCVIAEQSISEAFVAAILPGVLATLLYVAAIIVSTRLVPRQVPAASDADRLAPGRVAAKAWRPMALFLTVLGGLYGGIFTVQEAAAVGAGLAFLFWLASGKATARGLMDATRDAVTNSGALYLILIGAGAFGSFLNLSGAPAAILGTINPDTLPHWLVLVLLVAMYLVLGSVFDTVAALVITVPFVIPIILQMDGNLIWWGVVTLSLIEIGMITPPIGMNVFVLKGVLGSEVPIGAIFRGVLPFLMADLCRLALLISFPAIALWLTTVV
ncbi:TRAP transporter large permease subunit [Amorphus sp. 3PC139-8]|uniref:TRAP transporter large permease n=1 Tax=Amorphus sp. 3PC139-8 TaxID=2735676 RepID=UPI00345CC33C